MFRGKLRRSAIAVAGLAGAAALVVPLTAASAAPAACPANTQNQSCAEVGVSIAVNAITLSLSTNNISLVGSGLAYNGTPTENWSVTTNDGAGYHLSVAGDNGSTAFTNGAATIADSALTIQTSVNGGATTSVTGGGTEYTSPGPSAAAGDQGVDQWLLRLPGPTSPASGTYTQDFDYVAIQQ